MTYSKAHQLFVDTIQNQDALTNPQDFLGPNWQTILHFWKYIESLSEDQWSQVYDKENDHHLDQGSFLVMNIATGVLGERYRSAVWEATRHSVNRGVVSIFASKAAREIICMHLLIERGIKIQFLPIFGNL